MREYKEYIQVVIQNLKEAGLYLKAGKCKLYKEEVKYLGLIMEANRIQIDQEKVLAVRECEAPGKLKEVQAFLESANFYKRFIRYYRKVVQLLTKQMQMLIAFCESSD
jgi:hypothetical protein